ncbi:hypothetical protein CLF_112262 [Clonorchis sinensis]|uniref:Uncharacterized protein n=1 Tax=Clonorchis sinensis TaxID=79923 RepID=G7YW32_CLOSI|nr:hypothetical protein CLF_112262 [Clonorchis sinensis]
MVKLKTSCFLKILRKPMTRFALQGVHQYTSTGTIGKLSFESCLIGHLSKKIPTSYRLLRHQKALYSSFVPIWSEQQFTATNGGVRKCWAQKGQKNYESDWSLICEVVRLGANQQRIRRSEVVKDGCEWTNAPASNAQLPTSPFRITGERNCGSYNHCTTSTRFFTADDDDDDPIRLVSAIRLRRSLKLRLLHIGTFCISADRFCRGTSQSVIR